MKVLVVLPSYNESGNIGRLIESILALDEDYSICVVDDNSPDGSALIVKEYVEKNSSRVHLIVRSKKDGRGGAVRDGIKWGIEQDKYEAYVEMDCDFSHPPEDIPKGINLLRSNDVVMGSRYPDGRIEGWPLHRKVLSYSANQLARTLINRKIKDYTNGFRFYNLKAAQYLLKKPQKYKGYIYLSETISYFLKSDFKIASFPIIFINRKVGESNTTFGEVAKSLFGIASIAWNYRFKSKI